MQVLAGLDIVSQYNGTARTCAERVNSQPYRVNGQVPEHTGDFLSDRRVTESRRRKRQRVVYRGATRPQLVETISDSQGHEGVYTKPGTFRVIQVASWRKYGRELVLYYKGSDYLRCFFPRRCAQFIRLLLTCGGPCEILELRSLFSNRTCQLYHASVEDRFGSSSGGLAP